MVDTILGGDPKLSAVAYIDDVTAHGTTWEQVWEDTLQVLKMLTSAGFMVNLRKCKFLRPRVTVLGCSFFDRGFQLGEKTMMKWTQVQLPKTLKDLQSVLGKLLWASTFIPDYKFIVQPIERLLNRKKGSVWTQECTEALNQLA